MQENIIQVKKPQLLLAVFAGGIGSIAEWYNCLSYSYLTIVISSIFFPNHSENKGILLAFLIFAIGFLARPFGAIIFGYLGDTIGRQKTLILSQVVMAASALGMSILPTYSSIGIYASFLLALARILQGMSIGGEHTTAICYLAEIATENKKGLFTSTIPSSTAVGIMLASLSVFLMHNYMSKDFLYTYGWRINFFIGFILCAFSVYIRRKLPETLNLLNINKKINLQQYKQGKLYDVLHIKNLKLVVIVVVLSCVWAYFYQLLYIWFPIFLVKKLGVTYNTALLFNSLAMIVFIISILLGGYLCDRSQRKIIILTITAILAVSFPFLYSFLQYSYLGIGMFLFLISILFGIYVGAVSAVLGEIYPPKIRSLSLAVSFNISLALIGGFTPSYLQYLIITNSENKIIFVSLIFALVGFIAGFFIKEQYFKHEH